MIYTRQTLTRPSADVPFFNEDLLNKVDFIFEKKLATGLISGVWMKASVDKLSYSRTFGFNSWQDAEAYFAQVSKDNIYNEIFIQVNNYFASNEISVSFETFEALSNGSESVDTSKKFSELYSATIA